MTLKQYLAIFVMCCWPSFSLLAQDYPCFDFNTPGKMGNWQLVSCLMNTVDSPYQNPLDLTRCIALRDNSGSSIFLNELDFLNLGKRFLGDCISFDYNITNDGRIGSTGIQPTVYLQDIAGRTISFVAYTELKEGKNWTHVRAPIAHYDVVNARYPSNTDGQWMNGAGLNPKDFDYIIDNTARIYFSIDIIGSDVTTEELRFDNICVSKCKDSASRICNSDFVFTLNVGSNPLYPLNNHGQIEMFEYHKSSRYEFIWGDSYVTDTPQNHLYRPGTYEVKVRETTTGGAVCFSKLNICVAEKFVPKAIAGPLDSPCDAHFTLKLVSATNRQLYENNRAYITLAEPNASSTYKYDWGDANVDYWYTQHHYNPGEYTPCVTETQADRTTCQNCLKICVVNPEPFTTGVKTFSGQAFEWTIVPNPAREQAEIMFTLPERETVGYSLMDLSGKILLYGDPAAYSSGTGKITLATADLATGLYIIALRTGEQLSYQKLSVVH